MNQLKSPRLLAHSGHIGSYGAKYHNCHHPFSPLFKSATIPFEAISLQKKITEGYHTRLKKKKKKFATFDLK